MTNSEVLRTCGQVSRELSPLSSIGREICNLCEALNLIVSRRSPNLEGLRTVLISNNTSEEANGLCSTWQFRRNHPVVSSRSITFFSWTERYHELITTVRSIGLSHCFRNLRRIEHDESHWLICVREVSTIESISTNSVTIVNSPVTECTSVLISSDTTQAEWLKYRFIVKRFSNLSNTTFSNSPSEVYASSALILSQEASGSSSSRLRDGDDSACSIVLREQFVLILNINCQRYVASLVEDRGLVVNLDDVLRERSKLLITNNVCQRLVTSCNSNYVVLYRILTLVAYSCNNLSLLTSYDRLRSLDISYEVVLIEVNNLDVVNIQDIFPIKDVCTSRRILTLIFRRINNVSGEGNACEALTLSVKQRHLDRLISICYVETLNNSPLSIVNACHYLTRGNASSLSVEDQGWISTFNLDLTRLKSCCTRSFISSHEHCATVIVRSVIGQ